MCRKCYANLERIKLKCNFKKYYGLLFLLSHELLINYIPNGCIIPEIGDLIVINNILMNINNYPLNKYVLYEYDEVKIDDKMLNMLY